MRILITILLCVGVYLFYNLMQLLGIAGSYMFDLNIAVSGVFLFLRGCLYLFVIAVAYVASYSVVEHVKRREKRNGL